jgi:hypothetical protein
MEGHSSGKGNLTAQASHVSGHGDVINLATRANEEFPDVHPEVTKGRQRWYMLFVIGGLFVLLNAAVIGLIVYAIGIDTSFTTAHSDLADKRVITSAVFQTLIGATVVQTGAVTWAMARFLFPHQPD